jgi:hypothetical protein
MEIERNRDWTKKEPCVSANYIYESVGIRVKKSYCEIDGQAYTKAKYILFNIDLLCKYFSRNVYSIKYDIEQC